MAQFEKHFVQDLTQDIKIRQCGTIVFNADNLSNVISVELYNGTEPYSGGGTVAGAVICPDGATVALDNGTLTGNVASVTLKADCFAIPGQIGVGVQVISGSIRTTVLKAIYNVELLSTDNIVDPDSRITASVTQLVADIEAATAEIPASDMASLMAGIAPTFDTTTAYPAGAYVYYNGTLYRFTTAHAAGSWTGTDATDVVLGNDVFIKTDALAYVDQEIEKNIFEYTSTTLYYSSQTRIRVQKGVLLDNGNSSTVNYSVRSTHSSMYKAAFGERLKCTDSNYHIKVGYYSTNSTGKANLVYITPFTDEVYLDPRYYFAICITLVDTTGTIVTDDALSAVTQYFPVSRITNVEDEIDILNGIVLPKIERTSIANGENIVDAIPSVLINVDSYTFTTPSAGTYKSKEVTYTLEEIGLSVGDPVCLTIDSVTGCADDVVFSLEAYNGNTRILQNFVNSTDLKTSMVIPENTTKLIFVYRLCLVTSVATNTSATWTGVKLHYYTENSSLKVISPHEYYVPSNDTEKITVLENRLDYIDITTGSQDFFADEVETTIKTIESHSDTPSFVMAIVADPHLQISNPDRIKYTRETFQNVNAVYRYCYADGLAMPGDLVQAQAGLTQAEVDETIRDVIGWARYCNDKVFAVNGNHDGTNGQIPKTDNYATMLRFNENYVTRENGNPYYYVDYPAHKIRAIFICTNQQPVGRPYSEHIWGMSNEQLAWFEATLSSVPAGYDIVIFSHICTANTNDFLTNRAGCCTVLNTWISEHPNQKCIGWYSGHEHLDCIVPPSASGINCPQVILQCSLLGGWTPSASDTWIYDLPWVNNPRVANTVTQDCWTTLVYNKADNKVYLVRFGAGEDMTIDLSDYD